MLAETSTPILTWYAFQRLSVFDPAPTADAFCRDLSDTMDLDGSAAAALLDEIVAAGLMHEVSDPAGAHRLIAVSAAGAFVTDDPGTPWIIRQILPRIFARAFADTRRMEQVVRDSDLDWTLVRATRLVNDPGTGQYRVRADYPPPGGGKIARADVAHFAGAALISGSYIRESPALAY